MGEAAAYGHATVLCQEVVDLLAPRPGGVYCDGTLGRGGHAAAIGHRAGAGSRLIGVDRDPGALVATRARLDDDPALTGVEVTLVHGRFGDLRAHLDALGVDRIDGLVLDLGVSSPQLDEAERGFSFMRPGPIDMRMDPSAGPTALELIGFWSERELADVLFELGEERQSRRLAAAIKTAFAAGALATTVDLAKVVYDATPARERATSKIHPATRTFQALRIAVNRELDELDQLLAALPDLLAPGGRCAIISFHSLEDRRVKHALRELAWTSSLPPRYAAEAGERTEPVCELLTKRAITASPEEVAANPRSRSAKLRACERTAAPNLPAIAGARPPIRRPRGS
jgi:16S rRNA (cytosine1402-N4)-methyltransferase